MSGQDEEYKKQRDKIRMDSLRRSLNGRVYRLRQLQRELERIVNGDLEKSTRRRISECERVINNTRKAIDDLK